MFRVRNWTGEEINSGTRRKSENANSYPLPQGDVARVFTTRRGALKAAEVDARRGTERRKNRCLQTNQSETTTAH